MTRRTDLHTAVFDSGVASSGQRVVKRLIGQLLARRPLPADVLDLGQECRRLTLCVLHVSFVQNLTPDDSAASALARGLAGLAHGLHLMTIAEGIEQEEHATLLAGQGWTHGQGYLFGRPGPL